MRLHRTGLLIIATATLLSSAPAAHADTQYGGTGLYKGTRPSNPSISLLRRDDGGISGRVVVGARCRGYANYSLVVRLAGGTSDGVNFTATGRTRLGRGHVSVRLAGTLSADAATGTARVRTTGCRTYRNPFSLRTPSAPAGAAAVPAPGTLMFGTTSQSIGGMALPVALRVAKNGRVSLVTSTLVQCSQVRLPVLDFTPTRAIAADGTFGGTQRYRIRYKDLRESYSVTVRGRFLADGAAGTVKVSLRQTDDRRRWPLCRSGELAWAARG